MPRIVATLFAIIFLCAWMGVSLAQARVATDREAQSYIHSAFVSHADPGVMAKEVNLGPELGKRLGLPARRARSGGGARGADPHEPLNAT